MAAPEQVLLLGQRRSLVAVVTQAAEGAADRPTIVILNSGIVHRVGANRASVQLARALAEAGFTTVRFDLSGIGDSEPRTDALPPFDAALADIREALDALETTRGARRFVLMGLCSGADQSAASASDDPRVVGIVLLEPNMPSPLRQHVHHYLRRMRKRESWLNLARGENPFWLWLRNRLSRSGESDPTPREPSADDPEVRKYFEAVYERVRDRKIPLCVVLTGESWYYREAFLDAYPRVRFDDRLSLHYLPEADHVFTARSERERLIRLTVAWTKASTFEGR